MKTIELYYKGTIDTFIALSKGKFLNYFIPSVIVGILLGYYFYEIQAARETAKDADSLPILGGVISWVISNFVDLIDFIVESVFEFVVLVCFSPFNALLGEKYDNSLTGNKFDGGFIRLINDILRAIFIVVIALFFQLLISGSWYVLTKIINPLEAFSPIVNFVVPAFFFGFSLFDLSLERYGVSTFGSWTYSVKRMLAMLIAGSLFILLLKIPYLGIILAPGILTMITTYVYVHRENKLGQDQIIEGEESEAF